jgi:hypothetical protein
MNILSEEVLSLPAAARRLPRLRGGKPTHPTTLWRWARFGVATPAGRIKLQTYAYAGSKVTTWESVERFLTAVAAARTGQPVPAAITSKPGSGKRASDAKAVLDKAGIGVK